MKTIILLYIIVLSGSINFLKAQPLPPSNPDGSPVPLAGIGLLLFIAGTFLIGFHKSKKSKKQ
ncbi:hypothetical protein [Roseimarinus sediminis]|uniref:hypothetical protein n=1 Tax=Roseimarinus sediminis TaxID=1610899 RepID=UPI003D1FE0E3